MFGQRGFLGQVEEEAAARPDRAVHRSRAGLQADVRSRAREDAVVAGPAEEPTWQGNCASERLSDEVDMGHVS